MSRTDISFRLFLSIKEYSHRFLTKIHVCIITLANLLTSSFCDLNLGPCASQSFLRFFFFIQLCLNFRPMSFSPYTTVVPMSEECMYHKVLPGYKLSRLIADRRTLYPAIGEDESDHDCAPE